MAGFRSRCGTSLTLACMAFAAMLMLNLGLCPAAYADEIPAGKSSTFQEAKFGPSQVSSSASSFNVKNIGDYHDINLFLSNFAELREFWFKKPYDGNNPNVNEVVKWGFWHHVINNNALVSEETEIPGTTNGFFYKQYGTTGGSWYSRHTDTAAVENAIRRYLGFDWNLTGYRGGFFAESDGQLYESAMRGSASPRGYVALAESAKPLGGDKVEIEFNIYPISFDMITEDKWYTSMPIVARIEAEKNKIDDIYPAHAVVSVGGKPGDRSFVLRSMKVDV